MKYGDDSTTHPARAMDPKRFRAQATGIGQTAAASAFTGGMRAQRVIDRTDPKCRAFIPAAEGFPEPTPDEFTRIGLG